METVEPPAGEPNAVEQGSPEKNEKPLSLFPTGDTAPTPAATPPAPGQDEPQVSAEQKVSILGFREANFDVPPAKPAEGGAKLTKPNDDIQLETEAKVIEPAKPSTTTTPAGNPAIETEVVITNSTEPASPPKPQITINKPAASPTLETTLPLFTPATPAEEALERPEQKPQITIIDDFSEQTWPVGDNGVSSYRYFGASYEIDNRMADTMAISFQQNELASAQYSVESEFLDGLSDVGYGLAAHFRVNDGNASYYGLFISHSGEYLLLKVIGGEEKVLVDWMPCNLLKSNSPNIISLEVTSPAVKVFINSKLVTTVLDSSLRSGGYALLAGPGVAARFDNLVVNGDPAY